MFQLIDLSIKLFGSDRSCRTSIIRPNFITSSLTTNLVDTLDRYVVRAVRFGKVLSAVIQKYFPPPDPTPSIVSRFWTLLPFLLSKGFMFAAIFLFRPLLFKSRLCIPGYAYTECNRYFTESLTIFFGNSMVLSVGYTLCNAIRWMGGFQPHVANN